MLRAQSAAEQNNCNLELEAVMSATATMKEAQAKEGRDASGIFAEPRCHIDDPAPFPHFPEYSRIP
jgi:hypothetical protein